MSAVKVKSLKERGARYETLSRHALMLTGLVIFVTVHVVASRSYLQEVVLSQPSSLNEALRTTTGAFATGLFVLGIALLLARKFLFAGLCIACSIIPGMVPYRFSTLLTVVSVGLTSASILLCVLTFQVKRRLARLQSYKS